MAIGMVVQQAPIDPDQLAYAKRVRQQLLSVLPKYTSTPSFDLILLRSFCVSLVCYNEMNRNWLA